MQRISNDIPLEAVLKYIVKERDRYKNKLEILIPYTKSLEQKVKSHEKNIELVKQCKELEDKLKVATRLNEDYRAELKALKSDYKTSEWYLDTRRQMTQQRTRIRELSIALNKVLVENSELKRRNESEADR